jgi:hypothetical protein
MRSGVSGPYRRGLGGWRGAVHILAMSRTPIALAVGLIGFALYVMAVVALADHVLPLHWALQFIYFTVAGVAWAWPAKRLMFWAAGAR